MQALAWAVFTPSDRQAGQVGGKNTTKNTIKKITQDDPYTILNII